MRRRRLPAAVVVLAAVAVSSALPAWAARKDREPPTAPPDVRVTAVGATEIALAWGPSRDDVRVRGYGLYRDGVRVGSTDSLTHAFTGLLCGTSVRLGVDAYDRAGNRSPVVWLSATTSSCDSPPAADPLVSRSRARLGEFTDWLARFGASGFVGEVGWPGNAAASGDDRWNAVARAVYADAERAGLPVAAWAAGEIWSASYKLLAFGASPRYGAVNTALPQAGVIEMQGAAPLRGINVSQGEFGEWGTGYDPVAATSPLHNANVGSYGSTYTYPSAQTYAYLASRGITLVRLPLRWERLQRSPAGALDATELERVRSSVEAAGAAGLGVVLDIHNYGAYYLFDGTTGRRRAIGSSQVPESAFADLWRRLSLAFRDTPAVHAYGLMNEPTLLSGAAAWESASRAAVQAIRSTGDGTRVFVASYDWGGTWGFDAYHRNGPWISDPALSYEAHLYFDDDRSARYVLSYDEELARAKAQGH